MMLLCLAAPGAEAQRSGAVIEGYVRDRHGKPMQNVLVVLKGSSGQVDRTSTNQEGHYLFSQIGAGTFFISVEPKGIPEENRRVEFITNEMDAHRREDFIIESMEEAASSPTKPLEPVFHQQVPPPAEQAYNHAVEQLRSGNRDEGLAELERAVQLFPSYYLALNHLGMEYLQRGDAVKTVAWCRRALTVNRNSASARFGLGWAYYQEEKLQDALRELRESMKLNPRAAETQWFLGVTELERRQWREAERAFQSFLKLRTRNDRPIVHLYLASAYDRLGRPREAVASLETYLKAIPESSRTQKLRDLLAQLKRKRDHAPPKG